MVVIKTSLLSIPLLDWTIKQKRQNRNTGYVCIFALKVDFLCSKSWSEQEETVKQLIMLILETLSSDKKKSSM